MSETNKIKFLPLGGILNDRRLRKRLRPEYVAACRFFSAPLIDRTATLDAGLDFDVLDPLGTIPKTERSFGEICAEAGEQIARKASAENKKIQLLWSGGIDSTLALVSVLKALKTRGELYRLEVLLSKDSINEYPDFFRDVIEPELRYVLFTPPIYSFLDAEKLVVTGEHGDQIFGSDKAQHFVITKQAFRPYREILPLVIERKLGSARAAAAVIEYLAPQVERSPVPVETLFDYLWWMNFSLKWQHVSLRMLNGERREGFSLGENFVHFFSGRSFQAWSVSNHGSKIKDTWKSYKYVAKELIYDFHADEHYLLNKEKEQSLKDAIITEKSFIGFLKRVRRVCKV